jgi:hypothetical protein
MIQLYVELILRTFCLFKGMEDGIAWKLTGLGEGVTVRLMVNLGAESIQGHGVCFYHCPCV